MDFARGCEEKTVNAELIYNPVAPGLSTASQPENKSKAGPTSLLADELLVAFHPLVKLPLAHWAKTILEVLDEIKLDQKHTYSTSRSRAVCLNQAALVVFHFGQTERAFTLCQAQLDWISRLLKTPESSGLASLSTEPWVNFGRLERLIGKPQEALQRFNYLLDGAARADLTLGPVSLTSHWEASLRLKPNLCDQIYYTCKLEIIKTYLHLKDYEAVLSFVEQENELGSPPALREIYLEARIVAQARLGHLEKALELARKGSFAPNVNPGLDYNNGSFGLHRLIFHFRQVELLALLGNRPAATGLATALAGVVQTFQYQGNHALLQATITLRLVKLLQLLNLATLALTLSRQGFVAAVALGDEPLQFEFLKSILASPLAKLERENWMNRLRELARACCYQIVRRKLPELLPEAAGLPDEAHYQDCQARLDGLYSRLIAAAD